MEFIEAMLNTNFLPKRALKEVWKRVSKVKQKQNKNIEKNAKPRRPDDGTAVHGRTADRAHAHGREPPTHGQPCTGSANFGCFYLGCTAVHPCGTPVHSSVFLCFAILSARGFLESLIFLEITRKVFFSIET